LFNFLKTVFAAILVGVLVQIGTTVWWAGRLQSAVESLQQTTTDHEMRIRLEEKDSNKSHPAPTTPPHTSAATKTLSLTAGTPFDTIYKQTQ